MFTTRFQDWVRAGARRLVRLLGLDRVSPNTLTVTGLVVNALSGVLIATGHLIVGGVVLLLASLFDVLDGAVARVTGKVYRYGAFLDSTSDRYAEGFTYIGLLWYYLFNGHHTVEPMLVMAALTGSLLVSYVRARAQSLGFVCDGGLLARPERVVFTVIGLLIPPLLLPVLWILALLTNITAVQRIWFVWRQSRQTAAVD
ncbi:MAG: CDP-diacylglycerol---glycerol-3-phosphate 3-phosphatidyltransferase [Chloroflexota bacterium]|nr:CDP-diacylglycerol---glycerol-3-phosphate 3-phosphatidyltransferase [Chloroflexota bacterium]